MSNDCEYTTKLSTEDGHTYCCYWGGRKKQKKFCKIIFAVFPKLVDESVELAYTLTPARRLIRDRATRDTDKPEIQPVSEPESLHSCVPS